MAHHRELVELPYAVSWWKVHAPSFLGLHFQSRASSLAARTTLRQARMRLICVQPEPYVLRVTMACLLAA